jgi:predicted small metal-binding protein
MAERPKRWTCVEAGCSYELTAADVPSAIQAAQRHIAEAHGSFELEEMIEDVLEDAPKSTAGQTSRAARSPRTLQ